MRDVGPGADLLIVRTQQLPGLGVEVGEHHRGLDIAAHQRRHGVGRCGIDDLRLGPALVQQQRRHELDIGAERGADLLAVEVLQRRQVHPLLRRRRAKAGIARHVGHHLELLAAQDADRGGIFGQHGEVRLAAGQGLQRFTAGREGDDLDVDLLGVPQLAVHRQQDLRHVGAGLDRQRHGLRLRRDGDRQERQGRSDGKAYELGDHVCSQWTRWRLSDRKAKSSTAPRMPSSIRPTNMRSMRRYCRAS